MSDVSTPRSEVLDMQGKAAVCQALDGGTAAMRAAGKTYLPQWPLEEKEGWEARRDSSTLFPGFKKAVGTMVGKPFGEPMVPTTSTQIEAHLENIDLAGRDLDTFCRDTFYSALRDAITWILVDHTRTGQLPNLAAERAAGARPYWVHIPLSRIIGWRTANVNGKIQVTQVRFYEAVEVEDGPWGVTTDQRIRVLSPGAYQVWAKRGDSDQWVMIEEGLTSLQEIPIVPIYTGRTGFWTAEPPLMDLAWKNVEHWQSSSDQRTILHTARVPLLAADNDTRGDQATPIQIGKSLIVGLENLHYVEHTGAAIDAGRLDLLDIEDQMRRIAGELLESGTQKTAKEAGIDAGEGASWLKSRVRTFQDAIEECLRLHAAWMKDGTVSSVVVNCEWDDAKLAADVIQALTQARQAGLISQEAYTRTLAEGGRLPEGITPEDELASIEAEGPMAMTTLNPLLNLPIGA